MTTNHLTEFTREVTQQTLRYIQELIVASPPTSPLMAIHLQYVSEAYLPPSVYYLPLEFRESMLLEYEQSDPILAYEYIWNPANADYEIPDALGAYWRFEQLEVVQKYNAEYEYECEMVESILLEVAIALKAWCKTQTNLQICPDFLVCLSHVEMHTFENFFQKINPLEYERFKKEIQQF